MAARTGMRKFTAPRADLSTSKMWKAMRQLRRFTRGEVAAAADADLRHVGTYMHKLLGAGYVEVMQPEDRARHIQAVLHLVRNTGPVAPRFGKHGCYDANVEEPLLRPKDRPLYLNAWALQRQLRMLADALRTAVPEPSDELRQLLADADALILRSEGRA